MKKILICLAISTNLCADIDDDLFNTFGSNQMFYNDTDENLLVEFDGHIWIPMLMYHHPNCFCHKHNRSDGQID